MKTVFEFDANGFYIRPIEIIPNANGTYTLPPNCTDKPLPQPNYKPKFVNGAWVESMTPQEITAFRNAPIEKSELQKLSEVVEQLVLDSLQGGIK